MLHFISYYIRQLKLFADKIFSVWILPQSLRINIYNCNFDIVPLVSGVPDCS